MDVPETIGICPVCWPEFSVADAVQGDTCPAGPHDAAIDEQDPNWNPPLVIFERVAPKGPVLA